METDPFGEKVGEFFGTITWLWVFHRFNQDGAVLLGYQHPWEHGGDHGADHDGTSEQTTKKLSKEDVLASWDSFGEKR